ncbi:16585_t:CDS:2 [Cetraspora pellucida]|uniref:16585_t:CDS:1 n=1 Tax=Cetraspora pellucida TaxID=1433469 RepID=A0ACA9KMF8_9GLOM|nr:16585_t:CDS:2 [Cetraspora pellucida]
MKDHRKLGRSLMEESIEITNAYIYKKSLEEILSDRVPRDRRNRLARESYACRRLTLTVEQLKHRHAQQREAYRCRIEAETDEQTKYRRKTRCTAYMHRTQQKNTSNAAPITN